MNEKIKIEIAKVGNSTIDLNTYQAFSLEKVPIYDKKQFLGFLCFKITQFSRKNTSQSTRLPSVETTDQICSRWRSMRRSQTLEAGRELGRR